MKKSQDQPIQQNIPEMPPGDSPKDAGVQGSQSFPSTGSENPNAVSEELAGDLIALPFDAWHLINPAADPLSETEKARLAGPFARIAEKYGLGPMMKDEIVFGFYLTAICYGRAKACHEAKKARQVTEGKDIPVVDYKPS